VDDQQAVVLDFLGDAAHEDPPPGVDHIGRAVQAVDHVG